MTWPEDEVKAGRGRLKASDADRDLVIDSLKAAYVQGRLTATELDLRIGRTMSSRTYAELAMLVADIPELVAAPIPVPEPTVLSGRALAKVLLKSAAFVTAAIISMIIGVRTGNIEFIPVAFIAVMGFSHVVGWYIVDAWIERRSSNQLPPWATRHGEEHESAPHGITGDSGPGYGSDSAFAETRRDGCPNQFKKPWPDIAPG